MSVGTGAAAWAPRVPAPHRADQISGDTARVVVLHRCVNPPGTVHDGFARDDEYELVRDPQGVWHVRASRTLRITSRPSRLYPATPGAELAVATGRRDVYGSHRH